MKRALITGITGQDGAFLTELLLKKGYEVHGIKRRTSLFNTDRIDHLYQDPHEDGVRLKLHYGDLTDSASIIRLVEEIKPDEVYNLGAMSHVKVSFEIPEYTADVNALGALRLLEAIRLLGLGKQTKFYQASSSELFGATRQVPQTESTPFYPRSPYAVSKLFAYWTTVNYREAYGIFASNGILFNHESPMRGETFVTRKITRGACRIALGLQKSLILGNLNAERDWGHASDFATAMWKILQYKKADDFVVATGITSTVREFAVGAFAHLGITLQFRGKGLKEQAVVVGSSNPEFKVKKGQTVIRIDSAYFRPAEADVLKGDATKAMRELGWRPKYNLQSLIEEMVNSDLQLFRRDDYLREGGHKILHNRE